MKEEIIDLKSIDQKFLEIKSRLSSQKPKIFEMEQVSMYEKIDGQMDTHGTSNLGEMSKYRVELSEKKVLTEKNSQFEKCDSEYSVQPYDQNGKENKQVLPSYQSTFRQNTVQEYYENKRASETDPYSALLRNSECSKTSTFVIYPKVEDCQSSSTFSKIQKEFPAKSKILDQKNQIQTIDEQVLSRDENSTKYNFLNEGEQLTFKEEASNIYYSEVDQSMKQTSQKSYKQKRILSRQEVDNLSVEEKHEYILFLKNEISQELKKDQKYKQLQDEIQILNKNYKLEKELLQTEQDNRKLQIWILEDKKKQTLVEYDSKQNEKKDFMNMQNEIKKQIEQTKILTQEKIQIIQQIQIELENSKKEQVQLYFNQESLKVQKQNLKSEYEDQNHQLNQMLYKKNENENKFELTKQKEDQLSKNLEDQRKNLFFKDTSILGFKKEMKRIEDDIEEANLVKQTIKEEKDMYETQLSFLQKQKIIFGRDVENLQKKKKFQDDFIRYGEKNNDSLFDSIKENKTQISELQKQNSDLNNQIQSLQSENQRAKKENEKTQDYLLKLEDNTSQIIEITKFQDKIFKDSETYEKMRSKLIGLLNVPKLAQSVNDSKYNESCRPAGQDSKIQINDSKINKVSRSKNNSKLNISNVQDAISVRFQKEQNLENQETKRIFSDRGMSPIEKESTNSNGFMGLGKSFIQKNKGKNVDLIFYEEFGNEDQASQVTQEEETKAKRVQQKEQRQKDFKNIDKISQITSHKQIESPFTVRSIIGGQKEVTYQNKQVQQNANQDKTSNQVGGMPFKKNMQKPQNVANDLKSFLTKQAYQNNFEQKKDVNNTQDRIKMVNQIRSCSPLKIIGATANAIQTQNKNVQISKKQSKKILSKEEYDDIVIFNEIQQKNQQIKNGQIKHLIYLDESFINKNSSRKHYSKAEDFYEDLHFENFVFQQPDLDHFQNFQGYQQNIKIKPCPPEDLHRKNKKQFSSFQMNKQQNSELQKNIQRNEIFSDQQNHKNKAVEQQQNYYNEQQMISKSRPFRKSISPKQLSSQNSSDQKAFAQAVKMTILKGYQKESEVKKICHNPNVFLQKNQQFQHKNEFNQFNQDTQGFHTFQKKQMGTASKIETQRDRQPLREYQESRKQFSNSLADNNDAVYKPEREQARAAPLRKSISQRRDDCEKKSDFQSVNFQASSNQQSFAIQNQKVFNGKQTPKIEQQSVKSQQIMITPPMPAFKNKQIDFSKQSEEINEININSINRDFDQSVKSTRTLCANIPNKLLNNQEFINDISFQNGNHIKKTGQYLVKENGNPNNIYLQNENANHKTGALTFKKSQNSHSGSQYRNEIQVNDAFSKKPQEVLLNLKSNFARKSIDCPIIEQRNKQQYNYEIDRQNEDQNNQDSSILEIQQQNHYALNAVPQSFSSFQNNSIYQEFIDNKQENDAIKMKNENIYSKPATIASQLEFNKYKKPQPVYEQNYKQYQNFQTSQNSLNLKSNFSKLIQEKSSQLSNHNSNFQYPINQPINHAKLSSSSPRQLSASGQSKLSKQINLFDQVKNVYNIKKENQSQNQFQLDIMQKELKYLQSQIGDGLKPQEPKSALPGNYNRDLMKNDHCFSGSDIYIEPINLNTQRLECMPPINYKGLNQKSESFHQSQNAVQQVDNQSCKTIQTKTHVEKHNISQDQIYRIPQTFESRSELSNIVHGDQYDIKNKFRKLQDDLNMHDEGTINECEQESVNTYLSLRDQADIISQLRSCKESKKLN